MQSQRLSDYRGQQMKWFGQRSTRQCEGVGSTGSEIWIFFFLWGEDFGALSSPLYTLCNWELVSSQIPLRHEYMHIVLIGGVRVLHHVFLKDTPSRLSQKSNLWPPGCDSASSPAWPPCSAVCSEYRCIPETHRHAGKEITLSYLWAPIGSGDIMFSTYLSLWRLVKGVFWRYVLLVRRLSLTSGAVYSCQSRIRFQLFRFWDVQDGRWVIHRTMIM